jgi:hypothetical protein
MVEELDREVAGLRIDFGVASGWWAANLDPAIRDRAAQTTT